VLLATAFTAVEPANQRHIRKLLEERNQIIRNAAESEQWLRYLAPAPPEPRA
jgi:hypothetical protein